MSLYKRGEIWWIYIPVKNGKPIQRSTKTKDKEKAQELYDKLKADRWRQSELKEKQRRSWQEAAVRWCNERKDKKSLQTDIEHLRLLDDFVGTLNLNDINPDVIDNFKKARLQKGVANSTVNRSLALISAILNAARDEWEWIDSVPAIKLLKIPPNRVRWLEPDEIANLRAELPPHLENMMLFSLFTGLRESNVTKLKWKQVDLNRACAWVNSENSKNSRPIAVPLSDDAVELLKGIKANQEPVNIYVFTYKGHPVLRANNHAWRKALKRAGIEDFRWHDLRHCWATNHVRQGTPIHALKVLGGWESQGMAERYAHLNPMDIAHYANNAATKLKVIK